MKLSVVAYRLAVFAFFFVGANQSSAAGGQSPIDVFLVGDSISMFYTPYLQKDLDDDIQFSRKDGKGLNGNLDLPEGANGGNSSMVLGYLQARYNNESFHPAILLINAGLHDIKRDVKTNEIAISKDLYRRNLIMIEELARHHGSRLIWINTTPVNDERHNLISKDFHRYNRDVLDYNSIAKAVFCPKQVLIIDLYTLANANDANKHYIDHVHYDEAMRAIQAAYIAGFLRVFEWSQLNNMTLVFEKDARGGRAKNARGTHSLPRDDSTFAHKI